MTALSVPHTVEGSTIVARPHGQLDVATYPVLRDKLLKLAAEVPDALVVDVADLAADRVTSLSVFPTVWLRISSWPDIPVLLAAPGPDLAALLARSAVTRYVPVFDTVAEARAGIGLRPGYRRDRVALPAVSGAPAAVRSWIRATLQRWKLGRLDDVVLVASELVTNAIMHTATEEVLVRLELRSSGISVAVEDLDPTPPVFALTAGAVGLQLVAGLARAFGHAPALSGGKVVWAVVPRPGEDRTDPLDPIPRRSPSP